MITRDFFDYAVYIGSMTSKIKKVNKIHRTLITLACAKAIVGIGGLLIATPNVDSNKGPGPTGGVDTTPAGFAGYPDRITNPNCKKAPLNVNKFAASKPGVAPNGGKAPTNADFAAATLVAMVGGFTPV